MNKKLVIGVIAVLVLGILGFIIFRPNSRSQTADATTLYDYVQAQRMDLSDKIDETGTVVLSQNSEVYPAYVATVRRIMCNAGDTVRKGQLLMILDSPQMAEAWSTASSSVSQDQINLDLATKELKRVRALYNIQGATTTDLENAQSKVDIAQQQLQVDRLKLTNLHQIADNANFYDSKSQKLLIRAPFSGTVAWVDSKIGDPVQITTLLLSITADTGVEIEADIDESEINMIHTGQAVEVTSSDTDQTFTGVVTAVGNIGTDSSGSSSGSNSSSSNSGVVGFPVKIIVAHPGKYLRPGMSVDVTILANQHPNVLAVPTGAVVERRGKKMVGIQDQTGSGIKYVRVEVGAQSGNYTEILSGLQEGQTVAVPQLRIQNSENQQRGSGGMMRMGFGR